VKRKTKPFNNIKEDVYLSSPEVLRVLGEESRRNGTNALTSRQIDRIIKAARTRESKRG
jgi:hypothetical protein